MRNLDCPDYETCLNSAAKHNLSDWDCSKCSQVETKKERVPEDITGYALLLSAIFFESIYLAPVQDGQKNHVQSVVI